MKVIKKLLYSSLIVVALNIPSVMMVAGQEDNGELIKKDEYINIKEDLFIHENLVDINLDITEIPRYSIQELEYEDYLNHIESYFNSYNGEIIYEYIEPDNTHITAKQLEEDQGLFSLNTSYYRPAGSFVCHADYSKDESFNNTSMVHNLLNFPEVYQDRIDVSDEELSFASKDEANSILSELVQGAFKLPEIKVSQIKSVIADEFQKYVDDENINKLKENTPDWIVKPKDLYLIQFRMAMNGIPVSDRELFEFDGAMQSHGTLGEAIISEDGVEWISVRSFLLPGDELSPLEQVLDMDSIYDGLYQAIDQIKLKTTGDNQTDYYISSLEVVYIPNYVGNKEFSFAPVWQATIEYEFELDGVNHIHSNVIFIDPVTGDNFTGLGA